MTSIRLILKLVWFSLNSKILKWRVSIWLNLVGVIKSKVLVFVPKIGIAYSKAGLILGTKVASIVVTINANFSDPNKLIFLYSQ